MFYRNLALLMSPICWNGWARSESMFFKIKKCRVSKAATRRWQNEKVLELDDLNYDPFCVSTAHAFFTSFVNGHSNTHMRNFFENYIISHMQSSQYCPWHRAGARERFAGSKLKKIFYCKLVEFSASSLFFKCIFARLYDIYQKTFITVSALPTPNPGHIKL